MILSTVRRLLRCGKRAHSKSAVLPDYINSSAAGSSLFDAAAMSDVYQPCDRVRTESHVSSMDDYRAMYKESVDEPAKFWGRIADQFHWDAKPSVEKFLEYNFDCTKGPVSIKWMQGAKTNLSYNCLDRHLEKNGSRVAFYWEGNDPRDEGQITYAQLHKEVCKFANVLKSKGAKKGDRVAIYMPMVSELVVAMLACARIGAVHSIVFGGYRCVLPYLPRKTILLY